jgi:hypothetical protein
LINTRGYLIVAEYDKEIISLAQQILGQPKSKSDAPPVHPKAEPPAPEIKVEARQGSTDVSQAKETKTAAELAEMIEADLSKHPDCPPNGFVVTVYGATLWRAMLTITPAAGAVRNPQEWRDLTDELAERLCKRYDLAW